MFGVKLFTLANTGLGGLGVRQQAAPFLNTLGEKTKLTVNMAILEQNEVVLIEKGGTTQHFQIGHWVGQRLPLHCTGLGKALLAYLPETELDQIIKAGLLRHNENTIVSPKKLKEHLELVRKLGYAVDNEEATIGLRGIGAPILDGESQVIASISVAGTTTQITEDNLSSLAGNVKQAAAEISRCLGSIQ